MSSGDLPRAGMAAGPVVLIMMNCLTPLSGCRPDDQLVGGEIGPALSPKIECGIGLNSMTDSETPVASLLPGPRDRRARRPSASADLGLTGDEGLGGAVLA